MNIEEYKKEAEQIRSNETYNVYDLKTLEGLTLSLTELHAFKQTGGHSHDDADEVYFFMKGYGKIQIGEEFLTCVGGDVFMVPRGKFHKVWNEADKLLVFYAVFEKYGDRK